MILFYSLLTFSLLHSVGLVSGRWEIRLDGHENEEIPRPTSEPLLSPDEFIHGFTLMETRLGYPRNGSLRRDLALGARQLTCNESGYVLSCPVTRPLPCCPAEHPICCTAPSSTVCCATGTFCNGINTCCYNGQVPCTNPEGCCPGGTTCCGIGCCGKGVECRNGICVNARSNSSVASVQPSGPISDASSRSLLSVASAHSQSSESVASTGTTDGNGNSNSNAPLVGGVVGGVLGAIVLLMIGILLGRRNRGAPPIGRQPFSSQQPSSQPITPASLTFSMNSNDIGGSPVTNAAQHGWHPQQFGPLTLLGGAPAAGQISPASQQFAPTRSSKWPQRAPVILQDNQGGPGFQSLPTEGSVGSRAEYGNALRGQGPPHYAEDPITIPNSPSDTSGGASSPPPRYSTAPPVSERSGLLRFE